MIRLILMRHAKSDWNHPDLSDHDRPLNARGTTSAQLLGDWLRDHHFLPDQVLCSSAKRTRQTLDGLALPVAVDVTFTRALYLAEASEMMAELQKAKGTTVLMLGHNPGISEMAQRLVDHPPDDDRFNRYPTCATLVVDFDTTDWSAVRWHAGKPARFVTPHSLPERS